MPGRVLRRYLALGVFCLWLAPSAGALALGLHVALEHGGDHHGGTAPAPAPAGLEALLAAVVHGHDHHVDVPSHDHPAHLDAAPGISPAPGPALAVPAEPGVATDDVDGEPAASRHRRAPPAQLFRAHCSLLL